MASKRRVRRSQCQGKRPRTKDGAIAEATRRRRKYPGQTFDAYQCPTCGSWHVGHRPWRIQQSINSRRQQQRRSA